MMKADEIVFFEPSSKALDNRKGNPKIGEAKYPWKTVPVGRSFAVPRENIKLAVLRSLASRTGKALGKKFKVVDHGQGAYEVYHKPMTEVEAVQSSDNVVEALRKLGND